MFVLLHFFLKVLVYSSVFPLSSLHLKTNFHQNVNKNLEMASTAVDTTVVDATIVDASNVGVDASNVGVTAATVTNSVVVNTTPTAGQSSGGAAYPPGFGNGPILPPQNFNHIPMVMANSEAKPETFSGANFKRWREQMMFYLTTLNLSKFLTEEAPVLEEGEMNPVFVASVEAWKHSDYLCRNYVLNGLSDALFAVHRTLPTAKAVWDALEYKYKSQDAGIKKFIVGKFLDYKMVDSKSLDSQVQELEVIFSGIHAEGMVVSESFQVAAIIEKLPPSWKDFKNYLKHKRKEMTVKEIALRLRIEEDNRKEMSTNAKGKGHWHSPEEARANVVEHGSSSRTFRERKKEHAPKARGTTFKKKFAGKCFNCEKKGHKSNQCRMPKSKRLANEANMVNYVVDGLSEMNLSAMVSEVNLVGSNPRE